MPILKHAIRKLRTDKRRAQNNKKTRTQMKSALKSFRAKPEASKLATTFSAIDTAAKKHIIHSNRANRLKSRLNKLVARV